MRIGLYLDLAVGEAPDGAASWGSDVIMGGLNVGAPPDMFAATGQDWGLAAPSPTALAEDPTPFREMIGAQLRHAGALRIDHAMALRQLFLIPEGETPAAGAHVRYPQEDLFRVLAEESRRNEAVVIGEDLGFVPEGFRDEMEDAGILGYRILYFERTEAGFVPPARWPETALACLSTHDLPTLAGWWAGGRREAEARARARLARGQRPARVPAGGGAPRAPRPHARRGAFDASRLARRADARGAARRGAPAAGTDALPPGRRAPGRSGGPRAADQHAGHLGQLSQLAPPRRRPGRCRGRGARPSAPSPSRWPRRGPSAPPDPCPNGPHDDPPRRHLPPAASRGHDARPRARGRRAARRGAGREPPLPLAPVHGDARLDPRLRRDRRQRDRAGPRRARGAGCALGRPAGARHGADDRHRAQPHGRRPRQRLVARGLRVGGAGAPRPALRHRLVGAADPADPRQALRRGAGRRRDRREGGPGGPRPGAGLLRQRPSHRAVVLPPACGSAGRRSFGPRRRRGSGGPRPGGGVPPRHARRAVGDGRRRGPVGRRRGPPCGAPRGAGVSADALGGGAAAPELSAVLRGHGPRRRAGRGRGGVPRHARADPGARARGRRRRAQGGPRGRARGPGRLPEAAARGRAGRVDRGREDHRGPRAPAARVAGRGHHGIRVHRRDGRPPRAARRARRAGGLLRRPVERPPASPSSATPSSAAP